MELKALSKEAIPQALEKAERYRLLNEPEAAESICMDILAVEPTNQQTLVVLLLSRSDQLEHGDPKTLERARRVLPRLDSDYERHYYGGVICERQAQHLLRQRGPHTSAVAYDWFRYALEEYAEAIDRRQPGNDEAVLRWNTCVRLIQRHRLKPASEDSIQIGIE